MTRLARLVKFLKFPKVGGFAHLARISRSARLQDSTDHELAPEQSNPTPKSTPKPNDTKSTSKLNIQQPSITISTSKLSTNNKLHNQSFPYLK